MNTTMDSTRLDPPALLVEGLHKRFGDREVLKGVSLRAERGDVITLIGSSGSGKSTLLRCLNLLERPNKGALQAQGQLLRLRLSHDGMLAAESASELRAWRARLGFVFQHFNLWQHRTALENVIEGPILVRGIPKEVATEEAMSLLRRVGLEHRAHVYPAQLSGGEQQRVAIARALAMKPELLLFDEPTSALDPERVNEVLCVMRDLALEGRTMIVVTHEMAFARDVSTRTIFLHEGRVEEEAHPSELFGAPKSARLQKFLGSVRRDQVARA